MGQVLETKIKRFDGGIVNDPRDPNENTSRIVTNFDALTNPRKMTPYNSSESGNDNQSTTTIQNYCIALRTGTTYSLYGLGITPGGGRAEVYYKNLTTTAPNDLDDGDWTETSNNASSGGSTNFNLFVYYAQTGKIYGALGGTHIWSYDPAGSAGWSDTEQAITYTNIAQGLVHSKDDILYVPYDNKIAKNNNGSWTAAALTLPTYYVISSISEYGNHLAISCIPKSGIGSSRVFLWDRDSSLTTLSESLDWGTGSLAILEEIDGFLVGVSQEGGTSSSGMPLQSSTSFIDKVIVRYLNGSKAEKLFEITGGADTTLLPIRKQKVNNRLYFMMGVTINGTYRTGVWSIGRSGTGSPFTLIHERTPNNNTALASSYGLQGFIVVGDYIFQSYITGGAHAMSKTTDGTTYSHNSIYESKRFDGSQASPNVDSSYFKTLRGVTLRHEYLPSGASATLGYKKDAETSYTTILTSSTANGISKSATNIESSGASLPSDYREIEFQIVATGGAEITGFSFKEEVTRRPTYD